MDGRAALAMTGICHCERSVAVQEPESAAMDGRAALAMTGICHCERSVAVQDPAFAAMDGRAALAMTGRRKGGCAAALATTMQSASIHD